MRPVRPGYLKNLFPLSAGGGGGGDPYFANVPLLAVNDNKADGTTVFADQSSNAFTITAGGNAQYDTSQAPTGMTSSLLCDGITDFIRLAGEAAFAYGTGDVTIEGRLRINTTGTNQIFCDHRPAGVQGLYPTIYVTSGNKLAFFQSSANRITGGTSLTTGAWYDWAWSRASGVSRLFLDGTQEGSDYTDSNNYINGASRPAFGANGNGAGSDFNGWLCSLRVTKGVGRYTGTYTPPSLPLPTS